MCIPGAFVDNQSTIDKRTYLGTFSYILLVHISTFVSVSSALYYHNFVINSSKIFFYFFVQNCFIYLGTSVNLKFHLIYEKIIGILIEIALTL